MSNKFQIGEYVRYKTWNELTEEFTWKIGVDPTINLPFGQGTVSKSITDSRHASILTVTESHQMTRGAWLYEVKVVSGPPELGNPFEDILISIDGMSAMEKIIKEEIWKLTEQVIW
jgi:hypothetical protein